MTESLNWVRSTFRRRPIVVAAFNERTSRALDHPVKSLSRFTISLLRESVFDAQTSDALLRGI